MSEERWLPVVGYEGYYEVSDQGRVRSVDRQVGGPFGSSRLVRGVTLRPAHHPKAGHLYVALTRGNVKATRFVHRLVLEAFVGPAPEGMEGCHAPDRDPANNHRENLRWGTRGENLLDAVGDGTHQMTRKTHCPSGHAYTPENIYSPPSRPRARYCRACHSARPSRKKEPQK